MSQDSLPYAYKGEALLLRWGQSQDGRTVTLQLDPHVGVTHPFDGVKAGKTHGARMQVVCVLIDDQEQPVSPPAKANKQDAQLASHFSNMGTTIAEIEAQGGKVVTEKPRTPFRDRKLAAQAAIKLQDAAFVDWLVSKYWRGQSDTHDPDALLKNVLAISRKRELDEDHLAGTRWQALLTEYDTRDYAR